MYQNVTQAVHTLKSEGYQCIMLTTFTTKEWLAFTLANPDPTGYCIYGNYMHGKLTFPDVLLLIISDRPTTVRNLY